MKMKLTYAVILASALLLCVASQAQIATNTPQYGFFSTAADWISHPDTNNPIWKAERAEIYTTIEGQQSQTDFGLGVKVPVWKAVQVEALFKNAAVAGTVTAFQGGVGLGIDYWDIKLNPYIHMGYNLQYRKLYAAPGIMILKGMTQNTFSGLGLELNLGANNFGKQRQSINPRIVALMGVTF